MRSAAIALISGAARSATRRQLPIPLLRMSNMSTSTSKHFQGYGDPEGDPEASKARKDQKPANLKQTSIEHPGPEPVGAGKGKGGDGANVGKNYNKEPGMESKHGRGAYGESPTSDHPKDPGEASAQSGGSRSKDAKEQHERAVADETTAESDDAGMSGGDGASTGGAPKSSLKGGNKSASEGKSTDNKGDRNQDVDAHNKEFENTGDRKMKNDEERKGMTAEKGLDGKMDKAEAKKKSGSVDPGSS